MAMIIFQAPNVRCSSENRFGGKFSQSLQIEGARTSFIPDK
jgi:hypothetical protein